MAAEPRARKSLSEIAPNSSERNVGATNGEQAAHTPARPYVFHTLSACAGCGCSGDDFGSVNVEAFELTGDLYCDECAEAVFEENGQFGVGA